MVKVTIRLGLYLFYAGADNSTSEAPVSSCKSKFVLFYDIKK